MKKIVLAVLTAVVLVAVLAVAASAAGISEKEQALLDKFKAGVTLEDGTVVTPPAYYITRAEQELAKEDLTDDEIAILEKAIDDTYATIKAENLHNATEIKASAKYDSIVSNIQEACAKVGYTVDPNEEIEDVEIIRTTGVDMTATIVAVIALVSVLALSAAVIAKKRLLVK